MSSKTVHLITAKYHGPTNTRGSRFSLRSERFESVPPRFYSMDDRFDFMDNVRERLAVLGYTVLFEAETRDGYAFGVNEFCSIPFAPLTSIKHDHALPGWPDNSCLRGKNDATK